MSAVDDGRVGPMVGKSAAMKRVLRRIERMASTSATVLITGESGTGKELAASALHEMSGRSEGPFVAVNCGAIAPNLIESEFFGHERGSFTGANRTHRGFFEQAHRGTLFLDEVSEMPFELQVKLLRVLETREFTRIGGEIPRTAEVRVIAASNRPPESLIRQRRLRQDLYYRLKVLHLEIPPLRERPDDILPLARHFLEQIALREGQAKGLSSRALRALQDHGWPGNARELRNALYTGYLLTEGNEITLDALPEEIVDSHAPAESFDGAVRLRVGSSIDEAERKLILMTLEEMEGNKTRTAEVLGVSVKTLYNRLHAYGVMDR